MEPRGGALSRLVEVVVVEGVEEVVVVVVAGVGTGSENF